MNRYPIANGCFHTSSFVRLSEADAQILPQVDRLCRHYSDLWNHTLPGSDIWRLNHSNGKPITLNPETAQLLRRCEQWRIATVGAFDLRACHIKHCIQHSLPRPDSLDAFAPPVPEGNTLCPTPGLTIDLGSIAKGYVCDVLAACFRDNGITSALIDLGGNIYALGAQPNGTPWKIGIRDPNGRDTDSLFFLLLRDSSVVTSGMYERPLLCNGQKLHHIIDPRTSAPTCSNLLSVTVTGHSSETCDVLSTALTVAGSSRFQQIPLPPDVEYLAITADRCLIRTDGVQPFFS